MTWSISAAGRGEKVTATNEHAGKVYDANFWLHTALELAVGL